MLFSTAGGTVSNSFPISNTKSFQFLLNLDTPVISQDPCCILFWFYNSHFHVCEAIAHCCVICHFLLINDVMCPSCIFGHFYIFENYNFISLSLLPIFFLLSYYCCWVAGMFYILLDINPLSDTWCANIFSHFVGCLITPFIVCFDTQKI